MSADTDFESAEPSRDLTTGQLVRAAADWRAAPPPPISNLKSECGGEIVVPHRLPVFAARRSAAGTASDHPVSNARERTRGYSPRPAVSIRSCRSLPDCSAPAPPARNRWPRGLARARENAGKMWNAAPFKEQIHAALALARKRRGDGKRGIPACRRSGCRRGRPGS